MFSAKEEKPKRATSQKKESSKKVIKMEKNEKVKQKNKGGSLQEENLMSVLELLELQARARAIRSQLILETNKQKQQEKVNEDSDTDDAVIIEQPKNDEIVITSDSENEQNSIRCNMEINIIENQKIKPIRNSYSLMQIKEDTQDEETKESLDNVENVSEHEVSADEETGDAHDDDDIILIVDQDEIDGIMRE